MDFDLNEDQQQIKRTARELLTARSTWEKVRGFAEAGTHDAALWAELGELGWPGIAVAEEHGGQDLGMVELSVLLEEHGYALAATPLLETSVTAAVLAASGSDEQRAQWLGVLVSGSGTGGFGTATLAIGAPASDVVLVQDGDEVSALGAATGAVTPVATIDPTRRYATLAGDGEALGGDQAFALDLVRTALAAEVVGICQRALDMTIEYVRDRKQFGVPVGSFQAVSHRCAEMLLHTERVRSAAYYAAWAADADRERLGEAAALAAAAAVEAAKYVAGSAIQAHGGIGFTWEADVHWLYKRAQVDAALLGGTRRHRAALAQARAARVLARTA
jgi:alkylation response protein AidB-like acyl-CoA dehydrogenase